MAASFIKKCVFFIAGTFILCTHLSALPGFTPSIADVSGEYVYYEDRTFIRKSYIGFLYYDDATYAARYYAPPVSQQPAIDIQLFLTLDPTAPYIKLTGERITGAATADDTDIINYLHDLLYEFNARRIKVGTIPTTVGTTKKTTDDFAQFGGKIICEYNSLVPLFNLERISTHDGAAIFILTTTGRLRSSDDTSFADFIGMLEDHSDTRHRFVHDKNAPRQQYTTADGQRVLLDSQWTQSMDNLWLLGDTAIVSVASVPVSTMSTDIAMALLLRRLIHGGEYSYPDWQHIEMLPHSPQNTDVQKVCRLVFYQPNSNTKTCTVYVLSPNGAETYSLFTLTVFYTAYESNRTYFDAIVQAYIDLSATQ